MVNRVALIGLMAAGGSGIPRYAQEMTKALEPVAREREDLRISLVTTPRGRDRIGELGPGLDIATVGRGWSGFDTGPPRILREQLAAAAAPADLVHFLDFSGPLLRPRRRFSLTAFDAASLSVADAYSNVQRRYRAHLLPWAASRAMGVVAVSSFAATEAITRLRVPPERIRIILAGPGLPSRESPGETLIPSSPFILYVGNLSPSKNLPFLIRAFDAASPDARLVIVGRPRPGSEQVGEAVLSARSRDRISIIGDASDADVEALYRSALALVLPSRYEGFGFTPLEAMARGCPVIASDLPAVREVCGDAAILLPPDDVPRWAENLQRIAADGKLRSDLRRRGQERVALFSWDRSARAFYDFLVEHAATVR
jgi:glycosyltransferase involved in cell wall biosynthesis